ncbi:restriction endonuclease subunit S [Pseudomonas sp. R1-15]|uniref:restriction endonuclease subunit S n=1 Tax=Pseudomonas sp. R1-15 TaxID=2817399 RepID=UPI003DA810EE
MSELPNNWTTARLVDLAEDISYGYTASSTRERTGPHLLRITDIQENEVLWSSVPYCEIDSEQADKYLLKENDLVFARTGATVGKSFLIKGEIPDAVFASYLIRVRCMRPEAAGYLSLYFRSQDYWRQITGFSAGIGQPNVNGSKLKELVIPLPPLAEQTRIAAKLDELLAQVDTLKARIDGIPALLKRFRQSVLASAVSGKLTEGWRALNPSVSPILPDELKKAWADAYQSDGWKYKEADLLPGSLGYPLPNSWVEAKVGEVFDVYVGATPSRASPKFWGEEIPWVSSSEVAFCRIKTTRESITEAGYKSASTTIHPAGTVMLAMIGQGKTRGQPAILDIEACHNQNTAALRVHSAYCISEYLYYYLYERYEETRRVGSGNNQQALNKKTVQSLPFPLPPRAEQIEIVRRIEQLFAFADQLEAGIKAAQVRIDLLTQSILAKAFRGDLVPQDPNDEPASVLLDRIKAQRAAAPKAKRGRRSATAG